MYGGCAAPLEQPTGPSVRRPGVLTPLRPRFKPLIAEINEVLAKDGMTPDAVIPELSEAQRRAPAGAARTQLGAR